jgi:hypothetical protein
MRTLVMALAIALCGAQACGRSDAPGDRRTAERAGGESAPAAKPAEAVTYTEAREPCERRNPLRDAYFGDLHSHSRASMDAYVFGVHSTADEVYRFARGASLALPPLDAEGNGTVVVRLKRPLDFAAITDHIEFLGETYLCTTPGSEVYGSVQCQRYRTEGVALKGIGVPLVQAFPRRNPSVCGPNDERCHAALEVAWEGNRAAAQRASDFSPKCAFTAFAAYEYTGTPNQAMIHRNVLFRNGVVPKRPLGYFEVTTPHGLRAALGRDCLDAHDGCDVLAIPHNPNMSNGIAFHPLIPDWADAEAERARAKLRGDMEPVLEIYQHKGSSECSGLFSSDAECGFENAPYPLCASAARAPAQDYHCAARINYLREILAEGMREERRLGVNPYRLGVIGGSDTHNGTPGLVDEATFVGHGGTIDARLARRFELSYYGPGGLAGIWAVENSRDALFEAIRRRETFATSGPRIAVRLFGGWGFPGGACGDPKLAEIGYRLGVPMGGTLPARPSSGAAPVFVVAATKDLTPLQKIQIVKVWIDAAGVSHESVADLAGGAALVPVDTKTCAPPDAGPGALCGVWTDPAFDASLPAAYYARVLEQQTCRWTTFTCNALPPDERPAACGTPEAIQERAWTSPIWFSPAP